MGVTGFSHVTLNISDLDRSLDIYVDRLGMTLKHRGNKDAYLEWGTAWICIQQKDLAGNAIEHERHRGGVDHLAFHIEEAPFDEAVERLKHHHVPIVRGPVRRGSGRSVYFLDPDGIQLELYTSNLEERLKVWT